MTAKDLKNALLQEAVQGRLVPQMAAEGNARDLLKQIAAEKARLVAQGKIKKEKPLPPITADEIPFDIPENWCWCRLGDVFKTTSGTTPQSKNPDYYKNGTIPWVRTTDLNNGILESTEIKITEKALADCNLKLIPKNAVCVALYGGAGTIGKNAILNFETTINQSVCAIFPTESCEMKYLLYYLQWQRPNWMDYASGSRKDPNINQIIVNKCPFPLPPLTEQKRIVSAIEQFMPLIEEYGKREEALRQLNASIGEQTKKALLQEAVQGRLVPQNPAEGTATQLLKQIQAEKAQLIKAGKLKKEKPLPPITPDEIPFDIPENWCWCRLGEIVYNNGQKKPDKEFSYIDIGSIDNVHQRLNENETIIQPNNAPSRARRIVKQGDIIYSTVRPYLHNMCIIDKTFKKEPIASTGFAVMSCFPQVLNKFLFYYLLSPIFDNYANDTDNSKGVAYPAINDDKLYKGIIPLPPLTEQKRIVRALETLLPLCESLGR